MGGIIWLASYPKSGNTWLRAFLHNLLRDPDQPADINNLDQFCLGDSQAKWYSHVANGRKPMDMPPEEVAPLRPLVHQAFTSAHPDSVFAKTHNIMAEAHGVPLVTMAYTVGAIYIVRNPLDMVISLADHFGLSLDGAIAMLADANAGTPSNANNAFEFYGTWSQHVASWTARQSDAMMWLRYEDMEAEPRRIFRETAKFLDLDPPDARLNKAIQFSSFEELRGQERRNGFVEQGPVDNAFFRQGQAEEWRHRLTPAQIEAITGNF